MLERTEKSGSQLSMGKRTEGLGNWELEDQSGMLGVNVGNPFLLSALHLTACPVSTLNTFHCFLTTLLCSTLTLLLKLPRKVVRALIGAQQTGDASPAVPGWCRPQCKSGESWEGPRSRWPDSRSVVSSLLQPRGLYQASLSMGFSRQEHWNG